MKTIRNNWRLGARVAAFALAVMTLAAIAYPVVFRGEAQDDDIIRNPLLRNEPPFEFSDDFYHRTGIDPDKIAQRPGNPDRPQAHWVVDTSVTDPDKKGVRIRQITGGWDKDGNLIYYIVNGFLESEDVFRDDPRTVDNPNTPVNENFDEGAQARQFLEGNEAFREAGDPFAEGPGIKQPFRAFLFPNTPRLADGSPGPVVLDVRPPNRRQDNVFETRDRYNCENLLGLWQVNMVVYAKKGFNAFKNPSDPNHRILKRIADRNGLDLGDGRLPLPNGTQTPLIQRLDEIKLLTRLGLAELRVSSIGSKFPTPRWVI